MRLNRGQRDTRRSHIKVVAPRLTKDTETGSVHIRHRVDMKTGMYRGKQVIDVAARDEKLAKRAARKAAERGEEESSS